MEVLEIVGGVDELMLGLAISGENEIKYRHFGRLIKRYLKLQIMI